MIGSATHDLERSRDAFVVAWHRGTADELIGKSILVEIMAIRSSTMVFLLRLQQRSTLVPGDSQ